MIYTSIDIETSGLDHEKNCALSIGAIIEDTEKKLPFDEIPKFNAIVIQREITGSPRAITMNQNIIATMGDYIEGKPNTKQLLEEKSGFIFCEVYEVVEKLFYFLFKNGFGYDVPINETTQVIDGYRYPLIGSKCKPVLINVAGKNFGTFDRLFLEKLPRWQQLIRVKQRIADPAILFCKWNEEDSLPNLATCKERANVKGIVTHNALEDAWDVIQLLRTQY